MNDCASDIRRARIAYTWVGVIVPLVLLGAATALLASWLPILPDPIASHWGLDGADGFAPRWTALLVPLLGVILVAAMAVSVLGASRGGTSAGHRWSATSRFFGAMALGMAGMLATLAVSAAGMQRGLADASEVGDVGGWVLLSFGVWLMLGLVGWLVQPAVTAVNAPGIPAAPVPLGRSERAVWFGTVSLARPARIVIGSGAALVVVAGVIALLAGAPVGWLLLGVAAFLGFLMAISLVFRVRVSEAGLRVRSLVGWPNTRIPLDVIAVVEVVQLDPFAEFGGWGWRHALDGRRGVVLRRGEALQVTESGGRIFVVTVDGAREAGAVLQALRNRHDAAKTAAEKGEGS